MCLKSSIWWFVFCFQPRSWSIAIDALNIPSGKSIKMQKEREEKKEVVETNGGKMCDN